MEFNFVLEEKEVQKVIKPKIKIKADKELIDCIKKYYNKNTKLKKNYKNKLTINCTTTINAYNPTFQIYRSTADILDQDISPLVNYCDLRIQMIRDIFKEDLNILNQETLMLRNLIKKLNRKISASKTHQLILNMSKRRCSK